MAEVILRLGRYHLVINGVYVATEGDVCRDPLYAARWDKAALDHAAALINERRWKTAADRFEGGTE